MVKKKAEVLILKILGAGCGSAGFIVLALSSNVLVNVIGTALIGIGSLLMVGGSN